MRNWGLLLLFALSLLASGCASLTGRPVGLTSCETLSGKRCTRYVKDDLAAATTFPGVLIVANSLSSLYIGAWDDQLAYAFWSNALYFPLGVAAGAYTIQKKHPNALANVGIAAGTLAGANSFINARGNGKVYQSGINAMFCLETQLRPFVASDRQQMKDDLERLVGELAYSIAESGANLLEMDPLLNPNLTSEIARTEQRQTAGITAALFTAKQVLSSAVAEAQKTIDAANTELGKFNNLTSYTKNKIVVIDKFVETKITQPDVNFQALVKSLSPAAGSAPATPAKGTGPSTSSLTANSKSPFQTLISAAYAKAHDLQTKSKALASDLSVLGLSAAQKAVDDCIASM